MYLFLIKKYGWYYSMFRTAEAGIYNDINSADNYPADPFTTLELKSPSYAIPELRTQNSPVS